MKRFILLMMCSSIAAINLAQTGICNITPISGLAYFTNECGGLKIQSIISLNPMPYGECGGLIFLPDIILPENTTSTTDYKGKVEEIRIFPNPVFDILNVEIIGKHYEYQLSLFNSTGSLVFFNNYYNSSEILRIEIPTDRLIPGIYFIRVYSANGDVQNHKFIKI